MPRLGPGNRVVKDIPPRTRRYGQMDGGQTDSTLQDACARVGHQPGDHQAQEGSS